MLKMITPKTGVKFNNGLSCPILGLGTYKAAPGEVAQSVRDAIDIGYRHFDCALIYGNEAEIGTALKEKMNEGVLSRSDLFITSKLWNNKHAKSKVVPTIKESLDSLKLDYLDLYLIHWPVAFQDIPGNAWSRDENGKFLMTDEGFLETWKGLEECVDLGLTKSIGLSNFNSQQIQAVLDIADIKPVNNQVECHPYFNQRKLIDFCASKDITITAYGPLGRPMNNNQHQVLEDKVLQGIGAKHKKSVAQVCVRYQMQRGVIVIPKSVKKGRLQENWDVFDFDLTDSEMSQIDGIDKNLRLTLFSDLSSNVNYPFHLEY